MLRAMAPAGKRGESGVCRSGGSGRRGVGSCRNVGLLTWPGATGVASADVSGGAGGAGGGGGGSGGGGGDCGGG